MTDSKTKEFLPFAGKVIVNFGDSIFGNTRTEESVSAQIAKISGATVYNCGFGGCRMAQHEKNWDAFSMYRIAYSIAHGDFDIQNAVDVDSVDGMPEYFKEARALLESIDFGKVDIITISYGTNDFTAGVGIDNAENPKDITKYKGALRYSIEEILGAYPHIRIFVCGPTYRFFMDSGHGFVEDSDTRTVNSNKLTDFVCAAQEVSLEYHLPFINNYNIGICKFNRTLYFRENDGTHLNGNGNGLLAESIVHGLF